MGFSFHGLHGFLGLKSDWGQIHSDFRTDQFQTYSIEKFLPQKNSFQDAQENKFFSWAQSFGAHLFSKSNPRGNILVGYSLGGRLALHCLAEAQPWDGAILIGTNPGLLSPQEKKMRLDHDFLWAQRFLQDPWDKLVDAWDRQAAFCGQKNPFVRQESSYSRPLLSQILCDFSLGAQEDFRPRIHQWKIPILWVSGALDSKFCSIGQEMADINSYMKNVVVPGAGHRVPWEQPKLFADLCWTFASGLCKPISGKLLQYPS